jgi:hypothetical protein
MTNLDDNSAIQILRTVAQARLRPGAAGVTASPDVLDAPALPKVPELRSILGSAFGSPEETPVSEGDLARAALDVLAQDPAFAEPIQTMVRQAAAGAPASSQRYLEPATIALTTAALLVLQTRVKFKLNHEPKWSLEIDKKAASDGAVKLLVQRLLSFLHE